MILVIGAMVNELETFINQLENKQKLTTTTNSFSGFISDKEILVAITGVGKVSAARALTEILSKYNISLIINIGLAGASQDFKLGKIIPVSEVSYLDYDISYFGYELNQVPGYPKYFKSSPKYQHKVAAPLYTSDTFQTTPLPFSKPYLVDMEGVALYQVAYDFNKEIISFKYVSDHVGGSNQKDDYDKAEQIEAKDYISNYLIKLIKEELN